MSHQCLKFQFRIRTILILGFITYFSHGYVNICLCMLMLSGEPAAVSAASIHINEDEASNHGALTRL